MLSTPVGGEASAVEGDPKPDARRGSDALVGPWGVPAPYVDVEVTFVADLGLRAMVRAVAAEAAQPGRRYAQLVREATDTLVCALLQLAPTDARLRCVFRVLDGEIRLRASLSDPRVTGPEAKALTARILDRLDVHVSTFTTTGDDQRTELVYETVVPRREGANPGF